MKGSIIGHLVLKDWRLNRLLILLTLAIGLVALLVTQFGGLAVSSASCGSLWHSAFWAACCPAQPS